jgi:protein-S-isoprenylcysteine O-methyltransferase Ste14
VTAISDTRLYDTLMRLPIVVFTGYFLLRESIAIREIVGVHPYVGGDWRFFIAVAARIFIMIFLVLLASLHLSRYRPVRKYPMWVPKITALLGLLVIYLLMLVPRAEFNPTWDGLSTTLLLVGNIVCILAVLDLGRSLSIMPEARRLVTTGIYRRIRHPLYLAEEIALAGIAVQFRSLEAAAVLCLHFYCQIRRMDWEEGILTAAFPEYADYARRSYRLVPGLY